MTKEGKKLKARKVENPMKWMEDDAFHAAVKDELHKFLSSNSYIKVPKRYMSAILLIAQHFAEWGKRQAGHTTNANEHTTNANEKM